MSEKPNDADYQNAYDRAAAELALRSLRVITDPETGNRYIAPPPPTEPEGRG